MPPIKSPAEPLRAFHALGQRADEIPGKNQSRYGKKHVQKAADRAGCSESQMFAARQFAAEYSAENLDRICGLRGTHDEHIRVSHVRLLVSVPKGDRQQLEQLIVAKGLSAQQLADEIRRRYGKRGQGGRRWKLPSDQDDLLRQVERMCEKWLSHAKSYGARDDDLDALPPPVRAAYSEVAGAVDELRQQVAKALSRQKRNTPRKKK